MPDTDVQTPVVVEVLEDEDGEVGFATGAVEPALMVLSTVIERMRNVGAQDAEQILLGGPTRYADGEQWTMNDQDDQANRMLASVRQVWLREDPENDDNMLPAEPDEPGAQLFTRVDIPW